jgi:hypothetical protein
VTTHQENEMTNDAPSRTLDELLNQPEQDPVEADPDEWLIAPARARRLPKLTAALVAGIVLAAAFTGGVLVQKHHDRSLAASSSASLPSGALPAGGFGSLSGASQSASSGTTSASSSPAVIGTVVSIHGRVVTVRNVAGKTVKVTVPASTTVTNQRTISLTNLTRGRSVVVTGTTRTDGTVTATAITTR